MGGTMRWWLVGGVAVALVIALMTVPVLPAAEETEAPVTGTWTFDSPEVGACVSVAVDATLTGREVRPVISALPWRLWADTSLADPVEIAAAAPAGCEPVDGELDRIGAYVLMGDSDCADWPEDADGDLTLPEADHVTGCGGDAVRFTLATDEPADGISLSDSLLPGEVHADRSGCIDLDVAGEVQVSRGGTGASDAPAPDGGLPLRVCLEPAD